MARKKIPLAADQLKLLERLAGQGLNVVQMAAILGMSKPTFDRRMKDTPGAIESLEKGRALAARRITRTAYRMAASGESPAMTMFWLKCRERWTEVQRVEHSGPDGKPIETKDVSTITDQELDARIEAKLAKGEKKP